ncbi:hypothetical protein [Leptolyngbya sp. BL0902]|uniref:hypothetical protein n=1 Tax=Leptolyngbya sp. BL0902 TaxID=1115757 RepID=UPI0018E841A1|nr:hypothetical protein [Leptolyngbya sp. BL0902]
MRSSSSPSFPSSPSSPSAPADGPVAALVNQVLESRYITQAQYQTLSSMVLADGTVDESERCQINRLFDAIQNGRVKIRP